MKRPNQIFSPGGVDSRLSANRTVHLRNDGGGNLNIGNAPVINGSGKTSQVSDDSSAKRDEEGGAVETGFDHGVADESQLGNRLRGLACGNRYEQRLKASLGERKLDRLSVKRSDIRVGHHHATAGLRHAGNQLAAGRNRPGADENFVRRSG